MYNQELEKLKNDIQEIENKIDDNDEFVFEDEFETLNDAILAQHDELFEDLNAYFDKDVINEKVEELVHKQLKELAKLKKRINAIQSQAGKESNEDILGFMFPDGDED